jgi:hypothetical protein
MDIAGHVSKRVLQHYSHIRMEAKRRALESILVKENSPEIHPKTVEPAPPQRNLTDGVATPGVIN